MAQKQLEERVETTKKDISGLKESVQRIEKRMERMMMMLVDLMAGKGKSTTDVAKGFSKLRDLTLDETEEDKEQIQGSNELQKDFQDVFELPPGLPSVRGVDHQIVLKEGTGAVNVRPYKYAHAQKEEIERLIQEMLLSGIIRPEYQPFFKPNSGSQKERWGLEILSGL